jgi:hypothetical protein
VRIRLGSRRKREAVRQAVAGMGFWHGQALLWSQDLRDLALSNLDGFSFEWPASTRFQVAAMTPVQVAPLGSATRIQVTNHGKGNVHVERWTAGGGAKLGETTVRERMSTVVRFEVGTALVRLTSPNLVPQGQHPTRGEYLLIR